MSHPAHFPALSACATLWVYASPQTTKQTHPSLILFQGHFAQPQTMNKHSLRVTLLYLLVLTLSAWNGLRLWTALAWRNILDEFSAQPTPIITAISGAIWMVTGIILIWSLWQKKAWAWKMLIGAAAGYTVWYWSERLLWQNPHPNGLFAVIVNLALIVFILFTSKLLAREAHERKNENPKIE